MCSEINFNFEKKKVISELLVSISATENTQKWAPLGICH